MRQKLVVILLFFLPVSIFSQNHDHVWLFGYGSNTQNMDNGGSTIDFNLEPPDTFYEFREMNINTANASICDTLGNLLFYSNGNYIAATKDTVAVYDGFFEEPVFATRFFLALLAPDGKIYLSSSNSSHFLHVINNPDLSGEACDVCQHCFELPTWNAFSMPNFPNYRLGPSETVCDTTTVLVNQIEFPEINVFPNPAKGYLKVYSEKTLPDSTIFTLSNSLGEIVLQEELSVFNEIQEFNVGQLPAGIYYYSIQVEGDVLKADKLVIIE